MCKNLNTFPAAICPVPADIPGWGPLQITEFNNLDIDVHSFHPFSLLKAPSKNLFRHYGKWTFKS